MNGKTIIIGIAFEQGQIKARARNTKVTKKETLY
ncbi:hypothetical protein QFZ20_003359 [Flavobacterium sp. W4I14]|nr:hypothetical protein [Flavobacterium sp. W4I14]